MFRRFVVVALFAVVLMTALAGCALPSADSAESSSQAVDSAAVATNMQGMMTAMQGLMQNMDGAPMSDEARAQMQALMAGMQGMMVNMENMPGMTDMAGMEGMMANMQAMMAQMQASGTPMPMEGMPMEGMMMGDAPAVPAGMAFSEGQEIRFIHTEVSDADIAKLLTDMMASPVLVVPALANVPADALAPVYVFTNGPEGMGPLGFQPDVFPNPPGTEGYSPLRTIHLVTWADPANARVLMSAADVTAALSAGELTEEIPGVVVNMPFITWPDGER